MEDSANLAISVSVILEPTQSLKERATPASCSLISTHALWQVGTHTTYARTHTHTLINELEGPKKWLNY